MNILILNWRDIKHPLSGGAEISLLEHAKYWIKKGATVTWFCASFDDALAEETIEGIKVIRKGSQYTTHLLFSMVFSRRLLENVDIIIDCFHFIPFFTPLYIKKAKIVALINEPAKNAWFKNIFFPLSYIGYVIEPTFFSFYQNVPFITSAGSIVSELVEYGVKKNNIFLIPHGVSATAKNPIHKRYKGVIIYLAQLTPDKGIKDALYAFSIIHKKKKDSKLWVVGKAQNKKYEKEIMNLAKELEINSAITFYGYVSEKKKMDLLTKSDLLIHPSVREGWGLTIIEANTVGTPAVGYNVTGLQDSIKHMKTGMLTEHNTYNDLASCVITLLENEQLYKRFSKNAVEWAKTFSWESAGEKSWKLLLQVYKNQ